MKKDVFEAVFSILIVVTLVVIYEMKQSSAPEITPTYSVCIHNETEKSLSTPEFYEIAENSECTKEGDLTESFVCNEITGTVWIDINAERPGCNPACVVDIEKESAAVNWRCTGLIP